MKERSKRPLLRPRYASNSRIFERRGDPWVTSREGMRDYNRNPETEDAERDFDHRFHHTGEVFGKPGIAKPKEEYRDPRPTIEDDASRRKASIVRRMNMRMTERAKTRIEVTATTRQFRTCPGCRSSKCIADSRCYGYLK
jgi:hypothetical protein